MAPEPWDLVVAGGGPAGLATAIRARMVGLEVVVLERRRPPIDVACGEGLMPDGLRFLQELGLALDADDAAEFRGIRYVDGATVADGRFPGPPGRGIRRTVLHRALVARAEELGVELRWGMKVTGLRDDGIMCRDESIRGRYLAACDGRTSPLRRLAGLDAGPPRLLRLGIRRHYRVRPWTDLVEVHWGERAEAYVTPVGPELTGVAMLSSGRRLSFDGLLEGFPELAKRLQGRPVASRDRGAGPFGGASRAVVRGRLALIGDAAACLDPITGEGLSLSFHQAFAFVDAVVKGDLELYRKSQRRINRQAAIVTELVLLAERRPWLRRRLIRALAADPELFRRLLAIHSRQLPVKELGLGGLSRLAWGLVVAS